MWIDVSSKKKKKWIDVSKKGKKEKKKKKISNRYKV